MGWSTFFVSEAPERKDLIFYLAVYGPIGALPHGKIVKKVTNAAHWRPTSRENH